MIYFGGVFYIRCSRATFFSHLNVSGFGTFSEEARQRLAVNGGYSLFLAGTILQTIYSSSLLKEEAQKTTSPLVGFDENFIFFYPQP